MGILDSQNKSWDYFKVIFTSIFSGSYHEEKGNGVFVVTDIISLPVEASETRVTADDETYTLMAAYSEWIRKINTHQIVGWYHSHPSYGCWLSGIDVNTQELFQTNVDPFLAIVVDPIKSVNLRTQWDKS